VRALVVGLAETGVAVARVLRAEGATVDTCVCIIDREAGGAAAFADIGLDLRPLFTMTQLNAAAARS